MSEELTDEKPSINEADPSKPVLIESLRQPLIVQQDEKEHLIGISDEPPEVPPVPPPASPIESFFKFSIAAMGTASGLMKRNQENIDIYNEGYKSGVTQAQIDIRNDTFNFPTYSSSVDYWVLQGMADGLAYPLAFWGAKKLASARNGKEALTGTICLATGICATILNANYNPSGKASKSQGVYDGYNDCLNEGLIVCEEKGVSNLASYSLFRIPGQGIGLLIGAVGTGFIYGLCERFSSTNPAPEPAEPQVPAPR